MGRVIVITLTNKPTLIGDAISSVLRQTRAAIHWVARDDCQNWGNRYPPAVYFNEAIARMEPDDLFCWLSDDDLLMENYVEDLAGYLESNPEIGACYGYSRHCKMDYDGIMADIRTLPDPARPIVFDAYHLPSGIIDGGQVMMRRWAVDELPFAPEEPENARMNDAAWMVKLAIQHGIYPIGKFVLINRSTPLSAHTRPLENGYVHHSWRAE